ncbi:MAG: glycoside hydrolase family 3 C-terminal domain-containing protein [Muribaculaceae bacterium]
MRKILVASVMALCAVVALADNQPVITVRDLDKVIGRLTIEQKARLLVGSAAFDSGISHEVAGAAGWTYEVPSLGIPSINLADGPVGVRINPVPSQRVTTVYDKNGIPVTTADAASVAADSRRTFCTCFPSTTALAATWNVDMARRYGVAMGDEARAYGVDVILAPGINIMRNPLCGRNFEYYSEDPLLTGKLAAAYIDGIQSVGIGTSLKHFVANNQQTGKKYNDARMSQRTLREIYLRAFEIAVKEAKPWTVMGSYNRIAGEFTQTNKELMIELLRGEWGFDGLVLTDWTVRRPTHDLLNARSALIMPGAEDIVDEIVAAVKCGKVSMSVLDACVRDVLGVVAKSVTAQGWQPSAPDVEHNVALSREAAGESMVLLRNDGTLPLAEGCKVALFGATAYKSIAGGTGSSNVNKPYVVDISVGLRNAGFALDDDLWRVYDKYSAFASDLLDKYPECPDWQKISYHRTALPEMDLSHGMHLVEKAAASADVAVVVIGRSSGETSDRRLDDDFNLTADEHAMIDAVCGAFHKAGKKVVVVMNVCGMMEVASWASKPDALLMAWFPGQECGNAVADVLGGRVNPSGRLPMTFPVAYADIPSSRNYPFVGQTEGRNFDYTDYEEGIWVGYRYFNTARCRVAFPFGYGLSYTSFGYSDMEVSRKGSRTTVSVTITNTGSRGGKEVAQLYVSAPAATMEKPRAELRGFAKTRLLRPGESERVSIEIDDYALASFDGANSRLIAEKGEYKAFFGASVEKIVAEKTFVLKKERTWRVKNILAPVAPVNELKINQDLIK